MSDSSIAALLGYNISQSKTLEVEPSDTDLKFAFQNLTYTNHTWDEIKSLYDAKDEYLNNVIFSDDGFTKDGETYEFDSLIDFVNDYLPEIYQ
jgi:alpha-D-ribose 1-methylphosphonate 5-phosphate C-P lyase